MKKFIFILFQINLILTIYSSQSTTDYNNHLKIPVIIEPKDTKDKKEDLKLSTFSFRIGQTDTNMNISGMWKVKFGYAAGVTAYPEIKWLLTYPGMIEGMIFEQSRFLTLDWITDSGIFLHLFINDNAEDTELTFRYTYGKFFDSLYITNKPDEIKINPYRSIKGGRPQDINFGFNWGNKIYQGRFDAQFDSVKTVVDRFKGDKIEKDSRITSSKFERGIYYYLPDKNIVGNIEVYLNDPKGSVISDFDLGPDDSRKFVKLIENIDFIIDQRNGLIKFKENIFGKNLLIYYQALINGKVYNVGDDQCGKNGILGTIDFNSTFPEYNNYIKVHEGKKFLVLSFSDNYSYFEEKNSYKIAKSGSKVIQLNIDILNDNNVKQTGFHYNYDEFTGCVRIIKKDDKAVIDNIYPFNSYENADFYMTFYSPGSNQSKIKIDYSCYIQNKELKLSYKPVQNSIKVIYNSKILSIDQYYYDIISKTITINFELNDSDIIEIYYLTDEEDSYNLTFALKNDFRLNDFLIIGDSFWYKMPIKLWEDSYYFKMHSIEILYFGHLQGDFTKLLKIKENSKLKFDLNAGFSMFYPELKGLTLVEDFEYELNGYKLNLHYKDWYPVDLPIGVYIDLLTAAKGRLYYRNLHKYGLPNGSTFMSIYDSAAPDRENYTDGANIGPYSSCDGFTYYLNDDKFKDKKNTLSLITELALDPNEAISIIYPISAFEDNTDLSQFNGLNIALKVDDKSGGDLYLFVDAGKISERYNSTDNTVQKEILDEGIEYNITDSGNYDMYKGKNDGNISTNDFDGNGILDNDNTTEITKFIFTETNQDYAKISNKYNNLIFKVDDIEKLKYMRGVRLTIYSPDGASAKLLFNQIRFTESGWDYNKSLNSSANEISPIEDSYLIDNIFSEENSEIDSKLHYQRFRERTLKINLSQNEEFYIQKNFITPIDISNFNKLSFFILLQKRTARKIKISMKDINNNNIEDIIDLKNIKTDKWEKIDVLFSSLSNYNSSNKLIKKIRLDLINEISDTDDNILYIDEFFMDEAKPNFGFGTNNNFIYSNPNFKIQHNNFNVFNSPYLEWTVEFDTKNFLKNELISLKDHLLINKVVWTYSLTELDYYFLTNLEFAFKETGTYNTGEDLRIKISKKSKIKNPFLFTVFYDYTKLDLTNTTNAITGTKNEKRNLLLELGAKFNNNINFIAGYDINTNKKTNSLITTKYWTSYDLYLSEFNNKIYYSISNSKYSNNLDGYFSLDNLYYLLKDDFISFYDHGQYKTQDLNISTSFYIIQPLYFVNNISVNHQGNILNLNNLFDFIIKYSNSYRFDVILKFKDKKDRFFSSIFEREIKNNYNRFYEILYWKDYFNEFSNSVYYITPLFFFPPFSSLYKNNNKQLFGQNINFSQLSDSLKLIFNWNLYLMPNLFCPYSFSFEFIETITNKIFYDPSYTYIFNITGGEEINTIIFNSFEIKYYTKQELTFKKDANQYKTDNNITLIFSTNKFLDFESSFLHELLITDSEYNKIADHSFILAFLIYKNFYKKNETTNDLYGFDMSYRIDIKSKFHCRKDSNPVVKIDNPIDLLLTIRLGYKFNKNFILYNELKGGYSLDYSQLTLDKIHRFGFEIALEGVLTF